MLKGLKTTALWNEGNGAWVQLLHGLLFHQGTVQISASQTTSILLRAATLGF